MCTLFSYSLFDQFGALVVAVSALFFHCFTLFSFGDKSIFAGKPNQQKSLIFHDRQLRNFGCAESLKSGNFPVVFRLLTTIGDWYLLSNFSGR
jgi:hypothetical protein